MEADERAGARAVLFGARLDRRRVQDERLGHMGGDLLLRRVDEERLCEERVPRAVSDHAEREPVRRVGARERIDDVELLVLEERDDLRAQPLEALLVDRPVDASPVDPVLGLRLADDELVVRRPARVVSGVDDERAALGELPLAPEQGMEVQLRRARVPGHATGRRQAVRVETDRSPQLDVGRDRHRGALILRARVRLGE